MTGALHNVKVLDLTHVLAGPFCTYQLGLLGADVIKIESPTDPDCARGRGPDPRTNQQGLGLNYQVQGGNKRALALDLRTKRGREILLEQISKADILVENYTTGALEALGLGYDAAAKLNPALIYCSITGFGNEGTKAKTGAYDNVIQATSGIIAQCGGQKTGVSFVDYATGYAAAFAITSALVQKENTKKGAYIRVSMLEVAMQMMAPEVAAAQNKNKNKIQRNKEAGISCYETANGQLMLGAFCPVQYRKLGKLLTSLDYDASGLAQIDDWQDVWSKSDEIKVFLTHIFASRSAQEWVPILHDADIPAEIVRPLSQAVNDPQLSQRNYFQPNPNHPDIPLPVSAFSMSCGGAKLTAAPPKHGEHTSEILTEMGLSAHDIETLRMKGIIA
jgi:crotonobetainyl-CoA:carnitine CoA-transferase CaiB-like acyl-CoA transferase